MRHEERHGYPTINAFVRDRIADFENTEHSFRALFDIMFVEGDRVFYESFDGNNIIKVTYKEAKEETERRAAALFDELSDVPQDAIVGLYMDNSLSWIEMFWAILLCGFKPLLMNLRLDKDTLEKALSDCEAAAVVSSGERFSVRTIIEKDIKADSSLPGLRNDTGSEILIMSSGSSGSLKLCAYGAEEFFRQVSASKDIVEKCRMIKGYYNGYHKLLLFLPLYHIFGLVAVYIWFAFFSCCFVQLDNLSPDTITSTIRRHGVTHIFAVPLFWEMVYEKVIKTIEDMGDDTFARFKKGMALADKTGDIPLLGDALSRAAFREVRDKMFGDSTRFFITGGSEISNEVLSFFNNIGCPLSNGYGMSEIGITSVELGKRSYRKGGGVGKPLPSAEYRIADDGELLIRSLAAAKYIIENGQKKERPEWYHTRDLAVKEGKRYRILGRIDDLVISPSGENLNPSLVEPNFNLPGIKRACLIADRKDQKNEPVLLLCVDRHITHDEFASVRGAVMEKAAQLKLSGQISRFEFIADELMGAQEFKLNRRKIAEKFSKGLFSSITDETTRRRFYQEDSFEGSKIREIFAEALGLEAKDIPDDFDFFAEGNGTSLDYLVMVARVEDEFDIALPQDEALSMVRPEEFIRYVRTSQTDKGQKDK